ncbi:hypothetical protein [Nocardioides sp.]|uniref:hypothetical protein n=1 Tax=Nocardioides sp. TaxID=35761 RepID=UPI00263587D1|nr:hypothetical protein [Nocardioides sp.]
MTLLENPDVVAVPGRSRRPVVALVVAVLLVGAVAVGVVRFVHRSPSTPPYADAAATGRIALCTSDGAAVTSGSTTAPLAAVVRGHAAIPAGEGQTATLFAFQPRQGAESSEWSGLALSAATLVHGEPTARLTLGADTITLRQFLAGYPATWDGWVQLRLLVGSTADGVGTATYDALDLTIDGDRWRAVDPGSCAS